MSTWVDEIGNQWADVPLDRLRFYADPYRTPPWGAGTISLDEVRRYCAEGIVRSEPWRSDWFDAPDGYHIARVAWFVQNPNRILSTDETAEIDVGISSLGYIPKWIVLDGNHRYAAALALGWPTMPFTISGCLDDAEEMFGLSFPARSKAA